MKHKYVGILGGMGYRATLLAYTKLNQGYEQKLGKGHTCPVRLLAIDFKPINDLLPYQLEAAATLLQPYLIAMDTQEVVANIMINNTLHEALDVLKPSFQLPFGHIGELLNQRLNEMPVETVMIIGTKYTMNSGYLEQYFPAGVNPVRPNEYLQNKLDKLRIIYYESDDQQLAEHCYQLLLAAHPEVNRFIIACTEHSMAFAPYCTPSKWIDIMDLQCSYALKWLESKN